CAPYQYASEKQPEGGEEKFLVQFAEFHALPEAFNLALVFNDARQHHRQFAAGEGAIGIAAGFLRQVTQAAFVEITDDRLALGVEQVAVPGLTPGNRNGRALRRADRDG